MAENTKMKPSTVKALVQTFLNEITSELSKGNRLEFHDFGVFEARKSPAGKAHNPNALEPIEAPAKRRAKSKMA